MRKLFAAAATASRPGLQTELSIWGTPNSSDALAAVAPPPSAKVSMEPMGASMRGRRTGRPKSVEVASTRSEERRVGKECRARREPKQYSKKSEHIPTQPPTSQLEITPGQSTSPPSTSRTDDIQHR